MSPMYKPRFELAIVDRATLVPLWSVTEYPLSLRKMSFEQQCEAAVNMLVDDLKALVSGQLPSVAAANAANKAKK